MVKMKEILICAALILTLASCEKDASRKVVTAETPDGHPFYFMPVHENGVTDITITVAWPMGWAYDAKSNPAVPYIAAEAILSGGTEELEPKDVLELFNDKNSFGHLDVTANHAIGELSFPKEHIEDVISIASEMLASPQFDQAWINRIKQGFLESQAQLHAKTANKMWAVARLAILGEGPLNDFLTLSNLEAIENVTVDDLRQWHSETIVRDGVTIAVTGAINRKDAGKAVDQLLSDLPKVKAPTVPDTQSDFTPKTILLHLPEAEKTTLGLLGQLPPTSEGGELTDLLAIQFFSRPGNGPLFDAVRTELRASYAFQAGYTNYDRATRIMFISGEVETAKLAQTSDLMRATYVTYRSGSDLSGLQDFRRQLANGAAQNARYVNVAARTILELALDGRNPGDAPRLGKLLETTTQKDVQERLASVFPQGGNLIVVAASPDANALPGACVITKIEQVRQCP